MVHVLRRLLRLPFVIVVTASEQRRLRAHRDWTKGPG